MLIIDRFDVYLSIIYIVSVGMTRNLSLDVNRIILIYSLYEEYLSINDMSLP